MIIEGCILILLSVLTLILALAVRNFGGVNDTEIVDGVIATSDSQKKEVIVNYKINNFCIIHSSKIPHSQC